MKWWIFLVSVVGVAFVAWFVLYAHVPVSTLLSAGFGAICLLWLMLLLTVPWNLYFAAKRVSHEIRASRLRDIEVPASHDVEARAIARRMLWLAITGHVVSAAVIAVITYFSGAQIGYYFSAFYLLATAFRPSGAYLAHLRERVTTLMEELHYPRDDVASVKKQIGNLNESNTRLVSVVRSLGEDLTRLRADLLATRTEIQAGDHTLDRRITTMSRQFHETVDTLNDNQELITGLKAFLRLIQRPQTHNAPPVV